MTLQKQAARWAFATITALSATTAMPQETPPAAPASTAPTPAKTADAGMIKYCNNPHIAYVLTSSGSVNENVRKGVETLAATLTEKTAFEPQVAALNIETDKDKLTCFRYIYWPITSDARPLSPAAQKQVQNYLDSGGMLHFDILDQSAALGNSRVLQRVLGDVAIKPLTQLKDGDTLTRSFYITSGLPGSKSFGPVWIEAPGAKGDESVSSVLIGDHNWADAWSGRTLRPDSDERKNALRAGINIVMYALTGTLRSNKATEQMKVPAPAASAPR